MLYELHLTTEPDVDLGKWCQAWKSIGVKPLAIQVDSANDIPEVPFQVMMADTFEGDDDQARDWVFGLESYIEVAGFPIVRSKVEVPLDKSQPYRPVYYEAHVKSLIAGEDVGEVTYRAEQLGWKASTNTLYTHENGLEKWYFTERIYDNGSDKFNYLHASRYFAKSFAKLVDMDLPFHTVRMEKEAVIGDTNPEVDEGWA